MENNYAQLSNNNSVTFWKVVFTFAVVIFHYSTTYPTFNETYHVNIGWRIAVEFFFIVSGFLLAHKCRKSEMNAAEYTLHRYFRLFPEYFFSLFVSVISFLIISKYNTEEVLVYLLNTTDELLMLHATAMSYVNINGALWYISAMVICGYFIYYLYRKYRDLFTHLIAPLSVLVIYSYLAFKLGSITGTINSFTAIGISFALLRGFAGMNLGVLAYETFLHLPEIKLTKFGEKTATLIEFLGYGIILLYTSKFGSTKMDFIFLVFFTVCTIISFSRKKKNIIFNNSIVDGLGKITYSIYLIHIPVLRNIQRIVGKDVYNTKLFILYLIFVIIFAIILHLLSNAAVKYFSSHKNSIKLRFFTKSTPKNSKKA